MKCPCTKDCQHRTVNCRSVCREFKEYDRQRMAGYADRDRQREKALAVSPFSSPRFNRYARLKEERFDHAVISDHSIRRCGVAIIKMVGGD